MLTRLFVIAVILLFNLGSVLANDSTKISLQNKQAVLKIKNDIDQSTYLSTYSPCSDPKDFLCNDVLNTGTALFTDPSAAIERLKFFHDEQSDKVLWVFSGRFYLKYEELNKKELSEEEIANYLPPAGISPIVRPEEKQATVYSIESLGLDKLGNDVLNIIKARYPGKQILVLFITDSFIAKPDFKLSGQTNEISADVLSLSQKNIFFRQSGLGSDTKQRIVQFFHSSYLDELDKLDNTNDADKRNTWLSATVKDILNVINNNSEILSELPPSPRERAFAYALDKAKYNSSNIIGYEEFKPGGYRYNFNALYNAKGYLDDGKGKGVVGYDMTGVKCGPNYIYPNTTAIAGIININATGDPCTRVTDQKLIHHYLERGEKKVGQQIADAIEFSMVVEARLAQNKMTNAQTKLFEARKDLLTHLAFSALPEDQQNIHAFTNTPFNIDEVKFRPSPKEIVIKPRPVVGPTSTPAPTVSPVVMVMEAWLVAAYIVDESIQSGHESFKARKTVELLFGLYKALDDASLLVDYEELFGYRIVSPVPADLEMLRQLKHLYENEREKMDEDMLNMYFWLLCSLEGDCIGPDPLKFEWHHIIPRERQYHPLVVAALLCPDKFLFNGDDNLISLQKYVAETGDGRHGNHPKYNEWILKLLNDIISSYESDHQGMQPDPCTAKMLLEKLRDSLLEIIKKENDLTVNEIGFKYLGN